MLKELELIDGTIIKTDEEIIKLMKTSKDIGDWNKNRNMIKEIRDSKWLINHIEQSGLINEVFPYQGQSLVQNKIN